MDKKQLSIILGENICKYRTQLGLTQAELAEKIGGFGRMSGRVNGPGERDED